MLKNYHWNIVRASCLVCVKILDTTGNFPNGDTEVTESRFSKGRKVWKRMAMIIQGRVRCKVHGEKLSSVEC